MKKRPQCHLQFVKPMLFQCCCCLVQLQKYICSYFPYEENLVSNFCVDAFGIQTSFRRSKTKFNGLTLPAYITKVNFVVLFKSTR